MSTKEILHELNKLPVTKRIHIIEKIMKGIDIHADANIEKAVKSLRVEYLKDLELTSFTALDGDKIYGAR